MFSSIPKLVDKNFVVAFIIPVLLGAVGILALLRDLDPVRPFYKSLVEIEGFTKLTIIVLSLWTAAILLLIMNHLLYRSLEGYLGPFNRDAWRDRLREQYARDRVKLKATLCIINNPQLSVSAELRRDYYSDVQRFCESWPSHRHLVLPTRFGNVIRAFETYANVNYGVDSIPAWLRLQGVMPKYARMMVDDARTQVDFFVNVWFLTVLFIVIAVVRCIGKVYSAIPEPNQILVTCWGFALAAAIGLLVCRLAYLGAIERARAWGDLVKSAFDLYLPDLAIKMGYELPATASRRRNFWAAATSSFLYQMPMVPEEWQIAKSAEVASPEQRASNAEGEDHPKEDDDGDDEGSSV
jgi:hypothetical protein